MENTSVPSLKIPSQSSIQSNIRLKKDVAWEYIDELQDEAGRRSFFCTLCQKTFRGGGINRMKQHLAGVKGNISSCLKVPADVKFLMQNSLIENSQKEKEKRGGTSRLSLHDIDENEEVEVEVTDPQTTKSKGEKRKTSSSSQNLQKNFKRGTHDPSQPSIKSAMQTKERLHDSDLALALWFYDACIPMNAVNSPLFPIAMSKVASMGYGYTGPSYHAMRVTLLKDAKQSVQLIVESYRKFWSETGCTTMSDGWHDTRHRPLINFLVYCPKGLSFIKSVDASDIESDAITLSNLFGEVVEIVGPQNVVHFVTDNAANYKAAGRYLCEKYPFICWSPCAAHCINLILKDVGDLPHVNDLVTLASRVTVFIYNHKWPLNWLRKRPGWTEIIRPGATRFGTTFIALKSLYDHKADLQTMVVSNDYKKVAKLPKATDVKLIVLDEEFWKNCLIIVNVMTPILRLLRVCDSDEKPALGYVYEGMYRARKGIKNLFGNDRNLYKTYTNIIDARWDKMLRKSLHCAAYWLNPVFQYDQKSFCQKPEVFKGVLDIIENKVNGDQLKLTTQLMRFRERESNFSRPLAFASRKVNRPDEWWKIFGGETPELQKVAIRILSQTASSSGCERNWSAFARIHTKRRNRLEHKRLNDLVYVHYNLRLQNRFKNNKRSYDPVDYESIDKTEFWVVGEETEGELNIDELENMLEEEPPNHDPSTTQPQTSRGNASNEEDDDVLVLDDD